MLSPSVNFQPLTWNFLEFKIAIISAVLALPTPKLTPFDGAATEHSVFPGSLFSAELCFSSTSPGTYSTFYWNLAPNCSMKHCTTTESSRSFIVSGLLEFIPKEGDSESSWKNTPKPECFFPEAAEFKSGGLIILSVGRGAYGRDSQITSPFVFWETQVEMNKGVWIIFLTVLF